MNQPTAIYAVHRVTHAGSSIEDQIAACETYCAIKFGVSPTIFVDREVSSGGDPGYLPLSEFCQANKGAIVLVKNTRVLTRMSYRQVRDLIEALDEAGARLLDLDGRDYTQTFDLMQPPMVEALEKAVLKPLGIRDRHLN